MADNNIRNIFKIPTNVPGLDDLFYGGLRLPSWIGDNNGHDGICIVIYGNRGGSKADIAMQIMRGVDAHLGKHYHTDNKLTPRYRTLNHRESELRKKYIGLEIGNMINNIKLPNSGDDSIKCKLCKYFPKLRESIKDMTSFPQNNGECGEDTIEHCKICKLFRHEILNYSDRSQSIHWTYGDSSDANNLICYLKEDSINADGIFDKENTDTIGSDYSSIAYRQFQYIQKEISDKMDSSNSSADILTKKNDEFVWSSYVIEGFTAFRSDELERLPFTDLILKLRKTSVVSILVFDERGSKLHLNADIIIHMQEITDEILHYTYYQLQIIKSDIQQYVYGWHKYRKLRDLSVKIYPSIHSLLTRRFSSDVAVLRLEQNNMRYPQSLLNCFQHNCAIQNGEPTYAETIQYVIDNGRDKNKTYEPKNTTTIIQIVDNADKYNNLYNDIIHEAEREDTTIAVFLLGKTEQFFRKFIDKYNASEKTLRNIHYWETSIGCIWAEEFASILKEYIYRWKKQSKHSNLHIILDDFANINLFPMMEKEPLLTPVLANICKNASNFQGFDKNDRNIQITITFVCTNVNLSQYKIITQLVNNQ